VGSIEGLVKVMKDVQPVLLPIVNSTVAIRVPTVTTVNLLMQSKMMRHLVYLIQRTKIAENWIVPIPSATIVIGPTTLMLLHAC